MSIAAEVTETTYQLTGANLGPFNTGWTYVNTTDVTAWLVLGEEGPSELEQGVDYTLSSTDPESGGGQVTLSSSLLGGAADWPGGSSLTLARCSPLSTETDWGTETQFDPQQPAASIDAAMSKVQELATQATRALALTYGEAPYLLPVPAARTGGQLLGFDSLTGEPTLVDGEDFQGSPGGNIMATGLFTTLGGMTIPAGTSLIQTAGFSKLGLGQARYAVITAPSAWTPNTSYVSGQLAQNGGLPYACLLPGESASNAGPSGVTGPIADGSATWVPAANWIAKSADGRWWMLAEPEPNSQQLGCVPDCVYVSGSNTYAGTDNALARQACADYVRTNLAYTGPGGSTGTGYAGAFFEAPGAYLTSKGADWSLPPGYLSGAGCRIRGAHNQTVIYGVLTEPMPIYDFTGHRNLVIEDLQIRVPAVNNISSTPNQATCAILFAQSYDTTAIQNSHQTVRLQIAPDAELTNYVRDIVGHNVDEYMDVGSNYSGGMHLGAAPPPLWTGAVLASTSSTVTLDNRDGVLGTIGAARLAQMPFLVVKGPNGQAAGGAWKKVRRITAATAVTYDGMAAIQISVDVPFTTALYGYAWEDGSSLPAAGSIAEVEAINAKSQNLPSVAPNQTYMTLLGTHTYGATGLTLSVVEQCFIFGGVYGGASGGRGLAPSKCAIEIAGPFISFWGIQTTRLLGGFYTENQVAGQVEFYGVRSYYPQTRLKYEGMLNVVSPGGSEYSGALIATGSTIKAWANPGNAGSGTIVLDPTTPVGPNAVPGDYEITISAGAETFTVANRFGTVSPDGGTVGAGSPWTGNSELKFTIQGTPDAGDTFTVLVEQGQYDEIDVDVETQATTAPLLELATPCQVFKGVGAIPYQLGSAVSFQAADFTPIIRYGFSWTTAQWRGAIQALLATGVGPVPRERQLIPLTIIGGFTSGGASPVEYATWQVPAYMLGEYTMIILETFVYAQVAATIQMTMRQGGTAVAIGGTTDTSAAEVSLAQYSLTRIRIAIQALGSDMNVSMEATTGSDTSAAATVYIRGVSSTAINFTEGWEVDLDVQTSSGGATPLLIQTNTFETC